MTDRVIVVRDNDLVTSQLQGTPVVVRDSHPTTVVPNVPIETLIRFEDRRGPRGFPGPQGEIGPPGPSGATEMQTAPAAVDLSGHRVVTPQADGTLIYADNTNTAHRSRPLWVTTGAALTGTTATAVSHGVLVEPSWSWAPGAVYLGENGLLTQTPPVSPAVFLAAVGEAVDPTTLFVHRLPSITLV